MSVAALLLASATITCKDDTSAGDGGASGGTGSPDQVGAVCQVPDDCYPDVDPADLSGARECLDRVRDGYCTHECGADTDCCAADGECKTDLPQVCSPFESKGTMMCFLSCEPADVQAAGAEDDQAYCQQEASPDFICRSSGGGSNNHKVCVPGDCGIGADCAADADCSGNLTCLTDYDGGYCGVSGCSANADCPPDSLCVRDGDATYCARTCNGASDCGFCRHSDHPASCRDDADFAENGTTGTVCLGSPA